MQIKKKHLIIAAGCLWMIAGINVFHIGFQVWNIKLSMPWLHFLGIILTFLFFAFILGQSYKKNIARISKLENTRSFFAVFDLRGWLLIGSMITLGVSVRHYHLLPISFIAFFYQGLGACLAIYGVRILWIGAMLGE